MGTVSDVFVFLQTFKKYYFSEKFNIITLFRKCVNYKKSGTVCEGELLDFVMSGSAIVFQFIIRPIPKFIKRNPSNIYQIYIFIRCRKVPLSQIFSKCAIFCREYSMPWVLLYTFL